MTYRTLLIAFAACVLPSLVQAQSALSWKEIQSRFLTRNPTLQAGAIGIEESKANEITAFLRPNPTFGLTIDQFQFAPGGQPFRPISNIQFVPTISELWERQHKRPLRRESAELATTGARADQEDLRRTLMFSLRSAFVGVLQAKAMLTLAKANLDYYDKVIALNQERYKAGDISHLDFQRVEIQRVQFESDLANAIVALRTAKIQLMALVNERTPLDRFDVSGEFEYRETALNAEELRRMALENRPDLRSAEVAVHKAQVDNRLAIANGTADPTIGGEYLWNQSVANTIGVNLSIPLRIFDKNQGEKLRTKLEIDRSEKVRDGITATIHRDVDSAYETVESVRVLVRPYQAKYLKESVEIRDLVSFSYEHGNATLLDFLDAQKEYRNTQLAYVNLVGSYYSAMAQLSMAVGQEVNP
jgi:cobalt-zinc-cadmium efflux system outer membrane protein